MSIFEMYRQGWQMGGQMAEQKKHSTLAGLMQQAHGAPREARSGLVNQMIGLDPNAGMAMQKQFDVQDQASLEAVANEAKLLVGTPEGMRAQLYETKVLPKLRAMGYPAPDTYSPEVDQYAKQIAQAWGRAAGGAVHSGFIDKDGRVMNRMRDGTVVWTGAYADPKTQLRDHPGLGPQIVDLRAGSASPLLAGGQPAQARPSEGQVAADQALAKAQVESVYAPATAGAVENARIGAQVANAPAVAGADAYAARLKAEEEARAQAAAEATERNRSNESAYRVYEQGLAGLKSGLQSADTGPVVGRLPAVTSGQQIAAGSVAAMAPVLKQLFRSAGEGVFTDKDQEMLIAMIPNRADHPAARDEKLRNIDNIVRAKLGMPPAGGAAAPKKQVKRTGTFNGRKVVQYMDGSVEYAN